MSKYKDSQLTEQDILRTMRSHRMPKEIERILPFSEAMTVLFGSLLLMAFIILLTNWLLGTVQEQMSSDVLKVEQSFKQVEQHALPVAPLELTLQHDDAHQHS